MAPNSNLETIKSFIRSSIPDMEVTHQFASEVAFELPANRVGNLGSLFTKLEKDGPSVGIVNYRIQNPSLEDVFLK